MNKLFSFLMISLAFISCEKPDPGKGNVENEVVELSLLDKTATAETKALYSNLWAIQEKGFMFGHHDDLTYGRYWYGEEGRSDTKDVCGDYPGVYGVDFAELIDDRAGSDANLEALKIRCVKDAYNRGMVVLAVLHLNNPLTGGDSWDNSNKTVFAEILKDGSATQEKFLSWLDNLADLANSKLIGNDGKKIPFVLRLFHEHTQSWSWWGNTCTTQDEFIAVWKMTIRYLRDTKGVHNVIYGITPQMDSQKVESDFYFRWPGDEWVDFIGMDCYQGINNGVFVNNLKVISKISLDKKKPCGVTETGVEGFKTEDYWTVNIHAPLTGRRVSMVVTWRNKYVGSNESDKHYFSVYKGHPSEKDFVKMYNEPNSFFCNDLPDMYTMAENISVN